MKPDYVKDFTDNEGNFKYYTNPVKAIRAKCLYDCCAGSNDDVKQCNCTSCFLHPFRFGKNPFRKPKTEKQLQNGFKKQTDDTALHCE